MKVLFTWALTGQRSSKRLATASGQYLGFVLRVTSLSSPSLDMRPYILATVIIFAKKAAIYEFHLYGSDINFLCPECSVNWIARFER